MMFVGFSFVLLIFGIKIFSGKLEDDTVKGIVKVVSVLTVTQFLEVIHGSIGIVPGGGLTPFIQLSGRLLVSFFMAEDQIRHSANPFPQVLLIVWSSIEIFRYSFYALRIFQVDIYPITWCRYTLFLPLYPMGGFSEAMILRSVIRIFEKTNRYTYPLPNNFNISFESAFVLKFYTYILLFPTIFYLMNYMLKQRSKQLQSVKEKLA